jgi:hypothetical protein
MTEANNNTNSFNSESTFESWETTSNNQGEPREKVSATANNFPIENSNLPLNNFGDPVVNLKNKITTTEQLSSLDQKMNWQKVAHKLREYNRKLLKKVFRLEQELADIDNKFNKYVEKSRSSDVLVANQETEIRKYQEQVELLERQSETFQETIDEQKTTITKLSQQYEKSQQQTARLERDCTLLQENYNHQAYELILKEKEIIEWQTKFNQQQCSVLQYQAELKSYQEQLTLPDPFLTQESAIPSVQNYSNQRSIQPWSTSSTPETISLPKTKSQPIAAKKATSAQTVKTSAQIATWSTSLPQEQPNHNGDHKIPTPASVKVKPKSLAAVDLPTFPRSM